MISENPRIAHDSISVVSQLGLYVFLRESAAGLSVAPPAMCHMVAVSQVGGGQSSVRSCHVSYIANGFIGSIRIWVCFIECYDLYELPVEYSVSSVNVAASVLVTVKGLVVTLWTGD